MAANKGLSMQPTLWQVMMWAVQGELGALLGACVVDKTLVTKACSTEVDLEYHVS